MKGINPIVLKSLSLASDLLQLDKTARKTRVAVNTELGSGGGLKDRLQIRAGKTIPNICKFKITLGLYDWLLLLFGYFRRSSSPLELGSGKNGHANRYLEYMVRKMRYKIKAKRYIKATKVFGIIMSSPCYRLSAFNHVAKGGYKNMDEKEVAKTLAIVKRLIKRRETEINFKRVYIEKADGGIRPLGVPTLAGRVYLHMINNLMVEGRLMTEGNSQHGYLPGRGVISAGNCLMTKLDSPNIYEADYSGFFNHVNHELIYTNLIQSLKFTPELAEFMGNLNTSVVKLTPVDLIPEPDRNFSPAIKLALQMMAPVKTEGVPQGAATSCSMATIALRQLESKLDLLIYADDLIYFPKSSACTPENDLGDYSGGLLVNKKKSHGTKRDGKWLREYIQFLGFRYYPATYRDTYLEALGYETFLLLSLDLLFFQAPVLTLLGGGIVYRQRWERHRARFMAWTRKGARLEFTEKQAFLAYLNNARTWLLNSSAGVSLNGKDLATFLLEKYKEFTKIQNPVLLGRNIFEPNPKRMADKEEEFKLGFKHLKSTMEQASDPKSEIDQSDVRRVRKILSNVRRSLLDEQEKGTNLEYPHVSLTGWFASRMQSDSGETYIKQDFRLKSIKSSGVSNSSRHYLKVNKLPENHLNTFTASSLACHNLLERLHRRSKLRRVLV